MARPKKFDLDYFPIDVGLINNPKLQLAINEVGAEALSVYIGVLCAIYSKSYYVPNNDPRLVVLPANLHMQIDRFNEVYSALVKFNLLTELEPSSDDEKRELRETDSQFVVTSKGVQEQYDLSKREGLLQQKLGFLLHKPELLQQEQGLMQQQSHKVKESKVNKNKEKEKNTYGDEIVLIVEAWNSIGLSKVERLSRTRASKLKSRISETSVEYIIETIKMIPKSDFLMGSGDRGWRASFDWLFANDTNLLNVREGKYHTKKKNGIPFFDELIGNQDLIEAEIVEVANGN